MFEIPAWAKARFSGATPRAVRLEVSSPRPTTADEAARLLGEATDGWATYQSEVGWLGPGAPSPSADAGELLEADFVGPSGSGWIRRRDGALYCTVVREVETGGVPCVRVATPVLAQERPGRSKTPLDYVTYWREVTTPAHTRQLAPWVSVLDGPRPTSQD